MMGQITELPPPEDADFVRQALAKDAVADHLVRALAGAGVLRSLEAPERRKRA